MNNNLKTNIVTLPEKFKRLTKIKGAINKD